MRTTPGSLALPAGMLLAAGRALGMLLATGTPLRSVVPAASLLPPHSTASPFLGRGGRLSSLLPQPQTQRLLLALLQGPAGTPVSGGLPHGTQVPSAPGDPSCSWAAAAKLSLSRGSAEGQEPQGFGEAPAKQCWWGGGASGGTPSQLPESRHSGCWEGAGAARDGASQSSGRGGVWEV